MSQKSNMVWPDGGLPIVMHLRTTTIEFIPSKFNESMVSAAKLAHVCTCIPHILVL